LEESKLLQNMALGLVDFAAATNARTALAASRWSGRAGHRSLLVALAGTLLVWAFIQIGSEMREGDTRAVDMAILHAAQSLRIAHPWVVDVMRDLSGLGSTSVLILCIVATVGYLVLVGARRTAVLVAVAVSTGPVGVALLKAYFGRPRPDAGLAELVVSGLSFPSGHATNSAIVFLTVAALLARTRTRLIERTYIVAVASVLVLLVGVSRIALGVHWATDVAAGWAIGAAWALAWMVFARSLLQMPPRDLTARSRTE
jgi:undecaprenyl-diphosphatase